MRTALVLLFLLSLGAIPGALLPQRSLNRDNVTDYIASHGKVAEFYDQLQLFDVFSSTWFNSIAVLLVGSLIGCIIPRSWDHYQSMHTPPVRAPKNLTRLALHAEGSVDQPISVVEDDIRQALRGWNVAEYSAAQDRAGVQSFAAEKGYLREFFNLLFHLSLVGMLVAMAIGRLVYYEGQIIVIGSDKASINNQFCNTATANFDSFRAGLLFDGTGLNNYCVELHKFSADYLPNGQAEQFRGDISYATGEQIYTDSSTWPRTEVRVNNPLRIAGDRVYLQGHGFAPTMTVTWPNGETRTQTVQFRPDDLVFFLSSGVMRFDPPAGMYPDLFERRQHQLSIQGLFAPTAAWSGDNNELLTSQYPAMRDPAVAIDIYRGDHGLDAGASQNIFSLDPGLIHAGQLQKIERVNLTQGESVVLDDGTKVTFDGAEEFANLQISYDPTQIWVLLFTVVGLASLVGSLVIKRRRIWVRVRKVTDGVTYVETAGLARTDRAGWGEEYQRIHRQILRLPDPDDEDE
ncbi:cytochrome c biogenesis protein ResB [Corynebacterium sp. HS2168-gen11]|uniref:cytochrome c biogenesis protein ResB n=1 Tax=Corynebacterium sp. HS2168-gen11 TaxID=2974027 RepID=UPI00216B0016|nr:cytochrome c biogenesis protein ResB [Corynebacterium sp. HS2168-gen11]MCS4535757.1 cytochrome c biogenesis protein ResB [Corynebacterium sp. HS2168-gen11]